MVHTPPAAVHRQPLFSLARIGRDYAYVMPGFFISLFAFVLLVTLTVLSVSTLIIWIGVLLLPFTLLLASRFADLSRARLRAWGVDLPSARYGAVKPGFMGYLRGVAEPRRWAELAFETLVAFPLRTFTFIVASTWTAVALGGITYVIWGVYLPANDTPLPVLIYQGITGNAVPPALANAYLLEAGFNFALGAVFLITLPLVMRGLASLDALVATTALGGLWSSAADGAGGARHPATAADASGWFAGVTRSLSGENWSWIVVGFATVASVAINWPLLVVLYELSVETAMLLVFAQAAALILVVRWPLAALIVQTAAVGTTVLASGSVVEWPWPWPVMTLIVQALLVLLVALRNTWVWAATIWLVPQIAAIAAALPFGIDGAGRASVIVSASVTGGVGLIGLTIHQLFASRGALREERRASADLSARRQELEERNRIAQELHDVVAHSMSVISVQATTARYRLSDMDEEVEREFESIAQSSRQALTEMRSLLALLRSSDDRELALAPQPTMVEIPELIEATRKSGVEVSLRRFRSSEDASDAGKHVPAATSLTAYRIVQEALSNAIRHSPRSGVAVTVTEDGLWIAVDIENGPADESREHPPAPGAGLGLAGVRERAAALGGTVEAGPTASGGWRVHAALPLT